jgi:HAD superfamily 5'-nucleotidase-like hydrolase
MSDSPYYSIAGQRGIYCNRTLNLRSIRAIGCDMDYTLIQYRTEEWERSAYEHARRRLVALGWPLQDFSFDPRFATIGLILDTELGNIVKANRFGYVKQAYHGTCKIELAEQRRIYSRVWIDLAEPRWVFLNTLFALSEACLYAQSVDLLDAGRIEGAVGYGDLYKVVRSQLNEAHMEGTLKREIALEPDRFVILDEELPLALLDARHAGKKLMLITNSEWDYTGAMMSYAFDRFLAPSLRWRDLFDILIVGARKPDFFSSDHPFFEVVTEDGLLKVQSGPLKPGRAYLGGNAGQVERDLGLSGDEILYIGDHLFADVHVSKAVLRWRTALVVQELAQELVALRNFAPQQRELDELAAQKESLEHELSLLRLAIQRAEAGYGPQPVESPTQLRRQSAQKREALLQLDEQMRPLARAASELGNARWGLLMRAGNDKSLLARQLERHSDIYMARVANLLQATPFAYLRSPRGTLPHDT